MAITFGKKVVKSTGSMLQVKVSLGIRTARLLEGTGVTVPISTIWQFQKLDTLCRPITSYLRCNSSKTISLRIRKHSSVIRKTTQDKLIPPCARPQHWCVQRWTTAATMVFAKRPQESVPAMTATNSLTAPWRLTSWQMDSSKAFHS